MTNFPESDRLAPEGEKRVALVDIDETICFYPEKRRYDLAKPSKENIDKMGTTHFETIEQIYTHKKEKKHQKLLLLKYYLKYLLKTFRYMI